MSTTNKTAPLSGTAWRSSELTPRTSTSITDSLGQTARFLPDARDIAEELTRQGVSLSLGASVYNATDPVGRLIFNVLGMVAKFEADLIRMTMS